MSNKKKNSIKTEPGTKFGTTVSRVTAPISFTPYSPPRLKTQNKIKQPIGHMPYRSAGGGCTGAFALRRTQIHYLPPPTPTMSSEEIKRRPKYKQLSGLKLKSGTENDNKSTNISKNMNKDNGDKYTAGTENINEKNDDRSMYRANVSSSIKKIEAITQVITPNDSRIENEEPPCIIGTSTGEEQQSQRDLNDTKNINEGNDDRSMPCTNVDSSLKKSAGITPVVTPADLRNENEEQQCIIGASAGEEEEEEPQNDLNVQDNCNRIDSTSDEIELQSNASESKCSIDVVNPSTELSEALGREMSLLEMNTTRQNSEIDGGDEVKEMSLSKDDNDSCSIAPNNTVAMENPTDITSTSTNENIKQCLTGACEEKTQGRVDSSDSIAEQDSNDMDTSGIEDIKSWEGIEKKNPLSDEKDYPNGVSDLKSKLFVVNASIEASESHETRILRLGKKEENSVNEDVTAKEDQGSVHAGNIDPETSNENICHETKADSNLDENIGNIEYPHSDDLKVESDDSGNTDKSHVEAVDRKRSELSTSELEINKMGHDLKEASADTVLLVSPTPLDLTENITLDNDTQPNITSVSHSAIEKVNEPCCLEDKLDGNSSRDVSSNEYDEGSTSESGGKILQINNTNATSQQRKPDCEGYPGTQAITGLDVEEDTQGNINAVKSNEVYDDDACDNNQIVEFSSEDTEGELARAALEFGKVGANESSRFNQFTSLDLHLNEVEDWGSTHSIGGESSITGLSSITNSVSTINSVQSATLSHLNYLAEKSSSTFKPSFTSLTTGGRKEDVIVREVLPPSQSQQKSEIMMKELFGYKSKKDAVSLAIEQARNLNEASITLLTVLIQYVQKCGIPSERKKGLVLPATAIGWLSLQFTSTSDKEAESREEFLNFLSFPTDMEDKMSKLKVMLAKCTNHLRVTGAHWPPDSKQVAKRSGNIIGRKGTQIFRRSKSKVKTPTNFEFKSALTFLSYYRRLQVQPCVNIALFPNLRSLEMDSLAPDFLTNLHLIKGTLSTMKVRRGCIFNVPRFFSTAEAPRVNSKYVSSSLQEQKAPSHSADTTNISEQDIYTPLNLPVLQHLTLSRCGIGELANLTGESTNQKIARNNVELERKISNNRNDGEIAQIPEIKRNDDHLCTKRDENCPPLSLMTNLVTLDLSNNELVHSSTALAGLAALPKLSSIDLSHNNLMTMKKASLMMGNIKCLILSGNRLSNVDGLDRMFSLERLGLDRNRIRRLCDLASLANLPQLMHLSIKGNPIEQEDPVRCRILLLNYFRESRQVFLGKQATYRDVMRSLPRVDSIDITRKELVALRELTFMHSVPKNLVTTSKIDSTRSFENAVINHTRRQLAPFKDEIYVDKKSTSALSSIHEASKRQQRVVRDSPRRIVKIIETGRQSKRHKQASKRRRNKPKRVQCAKGGVEAEWTESNLSNLKSGYSNVLSPLPFTLEKVIATICPDLKYSVKVLEKQASVMTETSKTSKNTTNVIEPETTPGEGKVLDGVEDTPMTPRTSVSEGTDSTVEAQIGITTNNSDQNNSGTSSTVNKSGEMSVPSNLEPKLKEIEDESKLSTKETLACAGISTVVGSAISVAGMGPVVGLAAGSYLGYKVAQSASQHKRIAEGIAQITNTSPTHLAITEDKNISQRNNVSIADNHSSVEADLRSDSSKSVSDGVLKRFDSAAAERDAKYDGPPTYADLFVVNYYEQYFQEYVFPSSMQDDSTSLYSELDTVQENNLPRIQLYQTDRDLMMLTIAQSHKRASDNFFEQQAGGEKFVSVSQEDVLPCGLAATGRIAPNEQPLRGFHGERLYIRGGIVNMVDSQKVIVCISNDAVYFMPFGGFESSTSNGDTRGTFPSPIRNNARFRDAYWLHAYCRHPLKFLRRITIGFGLQRLTLHFQLPHLRDEVYIQPESTDMMNSFHYTYVIFTCNKYRTNELLKTLQVAAKKDSPEDGIEVLHDNFVIDNDDRSILDAVLALAPSDFGGVIRHYQILYQIWQRGEREPIRRAIILTDDQILLFNENYVGENAALSIQNGNAESDSTGNVALQIIHTAELKDVLEICAADEDPRLITLVIKAPTRLRRSHRWRLACRDGENAERLIEDVRKATAAYLQTHRS